MSSNFFINISYCRMTIEEFYRSGLAKLWLMGQIQLVWDFGSFACFGKESFIEIQAHLVAYELSMAASTVQGQSTCNRNHVACKV